MKKHPLIWFYGLAFAISWLGWLPIVAGSRGISPFDSPFFQFLLILPAIGPAVAAIIVTRASEGQAGVSRLLKPLWQWRVGALWLSIAIGAPALLLVAGKIATQALGLAAPSAPQGDNVIAMVSSAFIMALLANPWEEVGWRGFALPRFQKRANALKSTLAVGGLWALWHLPLFFWLDNPMSGYPFLAWFAGVVAVSCVYTWLYNSTQGSLLVVALFHVLGNTVGVLITGVSVTGLTAVYCSVAVLLVAVFGADHLARRERVRAG
ncbi:MAG: CAAX amino terminal protease self- immunity [Chloroflexi bacterium ADurb.Bin360]|nr:MAG: CAAX amino terminal protease self- immunity [Chloroflexi bacterium ADurb.Bin360]